MEKKNTPSFLQKVAEDPALQAKLREPGANPVEIAREAGFALSEEDVRKMAELSPEELDALAGGRSIDAGLSNTRLCGSTDPDPPTTSSRTLPRVTRVFSIPRFDRAGAHGREGPDPDSNPGPPILPRPNDPLPARPVGSARPVGRLLFRNDAPPTGTCGAPTRLLSLRPAAIPDLRFCHSAGGRDGL